MIISCSTYFLSAFISADLYRLFKLGLPYLQKKSSAQKQLIEMKPNIGLEYFVWFTYKIVQQPCPPSKMDAITKNRNFINWPLLLYYMVKIS